MYCCLYNNETKSIKGDHFIAFWNTYNCHCFSLYKTFLGIVCHSVMDDNWRHHVNTPFICYVKSPRFKTLQLQSTFRRAVLFYFLLLNTIKMILCLTVNRRDFDFDMKLWFCGSNIKQFMMGGRTIFIIIYLCGCCHFSDGGCQAI